MNCERHMPARTRRGPCLLLALLAGAVLSLALASAASAYINWTDSAPADTTIGRANLDGTGVNNSFSGGANTPAMPSVDGSYIYWANSGATTIGRAPLNDPSAAVQDFITTTGGPFGTAVDGTYIYWANGNQTIGRAPLNDP